METLLDKHWHQFPADKVADMLGTSPDKGLDQFEHQRRLAHFGENVISGKRAKSSLERFLLQFHQPLVYILLVAGAVTALLGEYVDSAVIVGVVLVNAVVGFLQESKAVKALDALAASMRMEATVLRAGKMLQIDASLLVPGDVVILRSGDKVPADVRLTGAKELRIDESTLTGESVPVEKKDSPAAADTVLAERTCMGYAGTLVSYGQARGIVVATGGKTEIGRISGMIDDAEELETPLTRKISRFSHMLLIAIVLLAAACFVLGLLRDQPVAETFMAAVALAVGAIPEGLPAAVTIILALGVSRMADRKAIIRKLPAVETLGGTTVICSDKTGTLTENQMTVQEIASGGGSYTVSGTGYSVQGELHAVDEAPAASDNAALRQTLLAGLLCNDSELTEEDGRPSMIGDPTEAALLVSAVKSGLSIEDEKAQSKRIDELPFESDLQYMATLHEQEDGAVLFMKGAVEKVLACCETELNADGSTKTLDADRITREMDAMAGKGQRVLALAYKLTGATSLSKDDVASGMVFLGLQAMIDPPREESKAAVAACHRAGVAVKMITGDHAATARAIGDMLGLGGEACKQRGGCAVMTGREIAALSDEELIDKASAIDVFARVSPEQKLRLVMALQQRGEICAMTGDGVNDAPALKQANIGIAMGINGTEAAKEAADMVLTDDNFATIEAAVEEGRGVFDNLIKFIAWTLPTNAGEGLVILTAILFGSVLPILPVQILWINMTTAACLGMMLAFEPKEPGIMGRPPREPGRPILDKLIVRRVVMVSLMLLVFAFGLFEWEILGGATEEKARTMAVNVFVVVEAFYLFNSRSFSRSPFALGMMSNPWVLGGFSVMLLLQVGYTHLPFMNSLFQSAPLDTFDWLKVLLCGVLAFAVVELDKKRIAARA